MAKFEIETYELCSHSYEVEAATASEALLKLQTTLFQEWEENGIYRNYDEDDHLERNDDFGVPLVGSDRNLEALGVTEDGLRDLGYKGIKDNFIPGIRDIRIAE